MKVPIWMVTAIQAVLCVVVLLGPWIPWGNHDTAFSAFAWYKVLGVFMNITGVLILFLATRELGMSFTVMAKPRESGKLITSGVFQWCRNPIYLAVILLTFGWALIFLSVTSFVTGGLHAAWLFYKISLEEEFLLKKFGRSYQAYMARTPRLIPILV